MQQEIVALLDSAMNKWIDGLPEHCEFAIDLDEIVADEGVSALGPEQGE